MLLLAYRHFFTPLCTERNMTFTHARCEQAHWCCITKGENEKTAPFHVVWTQPQHFSRLPTRLAACLLLHWKSQSPRSPRGARIFRLLLNTNKLPSFHSSLYSSSGRRDFWDFGTTANNVNANMHRDNARISNRKPDWPADNPERSYRIAATRPNWYFSRISSIKHLSRVWAHICPTQGIWPRKSQSPKSPRGGRIFTLLLNINKIPSFYPSLYSTFGRWDFWDFWDFWDYYKMC